MQQIYPEPTVYVQTEACYQESERQHRALFPFVPMTQPVCEITADQLVAVLNSAEEHGSSRHYVLLEEK
jgi:hypothetical protein